MLTSLFLSVAPHILQLLVIYFFVCTCVRCRIILVSMLHKRINRPQKKKLEATEQRQQSPTPGVGLIERILGQGGEK